MGEKNKGQNRTKRSKTKDQFAEIFESMMDVYYRTDNHGNIILVSPSVYQLMGYLPKEIIGTNISEHYKDPARAVIFLEKILKYGRIFHNEEEILTKAGRVVFVSANVNLLKDEQGQFNGVEGIFRDITTSKKAEKALMESEERYRRLSDLTFEGIIIHDEGIILDCNRAFLKLAGYDREAIIGKNIIELAIPDHLKKKVIDNIKIGFEKPYMVEGFNRQGECIPVEIESRTINYNNKEARVTAIRDLSESFKSRDELQAANNMLEAVLNTIPVRVFWKDKNFKYLGCNAQVVEDANLSSANEIIGKNDYDLAWYKMADQYRKDDNYVIKNNKSKLNYEETIIDPDGFSKYIKTSKIPLKDNSGKIIGMLGCWEDITDQKLYEKKIEENSRRLERTNQELDNFVYRVSHDLKSPISSVKGLVNIARLEKDQSRVKKCLDMIEDSMNKLDEFILEILDYSRNARLEISTEPVNLRKLILDTFEQHKYIESDTTPEIHIDVKGRKKIRSDTKRLKYIFNNLISNSLKFSDPYKDVSIIEVDIKVSKEQVDIKYKDNGIGIHKDHIDFIFDMFYRATEGKPGSGLGLYIVKEVVDKLNGEIWVQSNPNRGTSFFINIPNMV